MAGCTGLPCVVWAQAGTTGAKISDAAAKYSQEGKIASFVFIILQGSKLH
jgi:hypothetical protein